MNFRMLSDIIVLQSKVEARDATIAEMSNEIRELQDWERDMHEILDEKNKDIAALAQELREVKEKLSKLEAWSGQEK
mgnify:FL=1